MRTANTLLELIQLWKNSEQVTLLLEDYESPFEKITINFELKLPLSLGITDEDKSSNNSNTNVPTITFKNCIFKKNVTQEGTLDSHLEFLENCIFEKTIKFTGSKHNIKFRDCNINHIDCKDAVFGDENIKDKHNGKFRLYSSELKNVNFRNTTFNNLADFWRCTFESPTTFYKTDFMDIVVFSAVTFKENVLFTYALIDRLMILRGTYPKKGFDISLAIISGQLSVFDFRFNDFSTHSKIHKDVSVAMKKYSGEEAYIKAYEEVYEDAVSNQHLIPIENKRETYRILKNQLENQKNYIDAIHFKVKESKTHFKQSFQQLCNGIHIFNPLSDLGLLSFNGISTWFGLSYLQGAIFTILIGGFFFTLALSHIGNFEFTWDYEQWQWEYFVQFLNPTHRFDYMKAIDENPQTWFFIWDFIGRIFVGYGIYQTIQAFRKYK